MNINWEEIKDGYRGFEKLALDYVKNNFKNPTWKKTKETRDGNKDAVAYIFGYRSTNNEGVQWWMEAKYSTERIYTNRYILDATIVSAILEDNIEKVIFVTNTIINSKTITDIRSVLLKSTNCKFVEFCTKYALEYWLTQNIDIYRCYFKTSNSTSVKIPEYNHCFLTQELEFYENSANKIAFVESAKELFVGKTYSCHFSFYSPREMSVEIKRAKKCVGIKILCNKIISLHKGDNNLEFQVFIGDKAVKNETLYFKLNDVEIVTAYPITIIKPNERIIDIPSQINIVNLIEKKMISFLKNYNTKYISICGLYGSGRTQILKKLGNSKVIKSEYYYQISFTDSSVWNSNLIVCFILFLLFPYLNPEDVDEDYLQKLPKFVVTNEIIELVKSRKNYDKLIQLFKENLDYYDFFPKFVRINKRIVFIDNLDYLDGYNLSFFFKLLKEIQIKEFPVFVVFTTENNTVKSKAFNEFSKYCTFEKYDYILNYDDINNLFNSNLQSRSISYDIFEAQVNIIELFTFFRYVYDNKDAGNTIDGIDSFIAKYKVFQSSNILRNHVIKEFNDFFISYPNCKKACDMIYFSHVPVKVDNFLNNDRDILPLLKSGLVKYDYYNSLMPINQFYQKYYINNYNIDCNSILKQNDLENPEYLKIKFENDINPLKLQRIAEIIIGKYKERKYNYILYVLNNVFEDTESINSLEKRMNNHQLFIELYFAYTYAVHLQSTSTTSKEHFKKIILKTKNSINNTLKKICIKAMWEMIIIEYEAIDYKSSLEYIKQLSIMLNKSLVSKSEKETILNHLKYHDAMTVKSQIEIDLNGIENLATCEYRTSLSKKYNFEIRYYNTKLRLAILQIVINIPKSISVIEECTDYFLEKDGEESKMYIIGKFSSLYYRMVYENDKFIDEVTKYHQYMKKNQYNNYRKRCYAMASYFYMIGDLESGNRYLFPEVYLTRKLANRNYAYYQETIALYEIINNNSDNAISALNKAYSCFEHLSSYNSIIKHNIKFIMQKRGIHDNIEFWNGKTMNNDKYYIDPRIIY